MSRFLVALLLALVLHGQTPAPEVNDPLGRTTPQSSVFHFLEACHARDYSKATYYLDLRRMPAAARAMDGPERARQLEDLLDDTPFDITSLSRDPEGDQADSLALIAKAHQAVSETTFEKKLPQVLVTVEVLDTPVWRWIALLLGGAVLW